MELEKKNNNVKWNKDTEYALGLHKKLINFLGYWPTEYQKLAKIRVIIINVLLIAVVIIFIKNLILYGNCGTDEELAEILIIMTANIMSTIKVILSWNHKNLYNNILNSLIDDWYCVNNNNSRKIMLNYAKIGRSILIFQLFGAYGTLISMFVRYPSTDEIFNKYNNDTILLRNIPSGPRCWISLKMPWYLYVGHYLIFCINGIVTITAYLGSSLFMFAIANHICGQFDILHYSIGNVNGKKHYKQQCYIIKKFVIRHNELLELLSQFEEVCNIIIFFEVFTNTIGICISGFMMLKLLQASDEMIMVLKMILRMFILFLQLFLYSIIGENLSNRAENLQLAIYNCNWYEFTPHNVKDMSFIILRTKYEFHLTAGKIQNMNMPNFRDIVKSIFSYLSILRLMLENSNS